MSGAYPSVASGSKRGASLISFKDAEVEYANALRVVWTLQNLGVSKGGDGIVISSFPMLIHRPPREFVVLGNPFIAFASIDQMNKVANFVIRLLLEQLDVRIVFHFRGESFQQIGRRSTKLLLIFISIGALPRAARKADLFCPHLQFREIAWQRAARTP